MAKQTTTLERFRRETKACALRHENMSPFSTSARTAPLHRTGIHRRHRSSVLYQPKMSPSSGRNAANSDSSNACPGAPTSQGRASRHQTVNFLLQKGNKLIVKLTDFGLAIQHERRRLPHHAHKTTARSIHGAELGARQPARRHPPAISIRWAAPRTTCTGIALCAAPCRSGS